jgi:hypothetical protein
MVSDLRVMTIGNSTGLLNWKFWTHYTFGHKSGICRNFAMASSETLNTEFAINKLRFLLVTHMVYSDARFDSYGILNLGHGAKYFLDKLVMKMNN